jgi:hypothetical protein
MSGTMGMIPAQNMNAAVMRPPVTNYIYLTMVLGGITTGLAGRTGNIALQVDAAI